jgi:hypothetical protein
MRHLRAPPRRESHCGEREREVNEMSGVGRKRIDVWMAEQFLFLGGAWE